MIFNLQKFGREVLFHPIYFYHGEDLLRKRFNIKEMSMLLLSECIYKVLSNEKAIVIDTESDFESITKIKEKWESIYPELKSFSVKEYFSFIENINLETDPIIIKTHFDYDTISKKMIELVERFDRGYITREQFVSERAILLR